MHQIRHILLAEDDPNDVKLTLHALNTHHLANQVDVVHDGAEALEYLFQRGSWAHRRCNPVLVLLDIKMPRVSGIEVLRQIKSEPTLQTIPVVMLTSSREERDLMEAYQLGVNAYVVKPVNFHEFVDAVRQLGMFWSVINEPPPTEPMQSGDHLQQG